MNGDEADKWNCYFDQRVDWSINTPGEGEERAGNWIVEIDSRIGERINTGKSSHGAGGGEGELVAAIVAPAGDVDVCQCYFDRDFYQFTDTSRNFPVLGFIGDRVGRIRGGKERGKNGGGHF